MSFVRDLLFGKAPAAPDYKPIAEANKEISAESMAFAKEQAAINNADRKRLLDSSEGIMNRQLGLAEKESARSDDYFNYAKQTFRPVEQAIARDAMNFNTGQYARDLAARAGTDVNYGFENARGQGMRSLSRMGVRPDSGAFAATVGRLASDQALGLANAQTNAYLTADQMKRGALTNAASVGRGYPGASQGSSQLAGGNLAGANSSMNQTQGTINQGAMIPGQYYSTAMNANNSAANNLNMGFQNQFANFQTQGMQTAAIMNAAGAFFGGGGRADGGDIKSGGAIKGPGTGISDSIPAMLSDGEYVIPADVVKRKGVEFFDKLLEKHHMPAAEQKRRYGIGGR
jgi:hypothetical protein